MLNNTGIPGGCEAHVPGTLSMIVFRLLTGEPTVLMDMPKLDTEGEFRDYLSVEER